MTRLIERDSTKVFTDHNVYILGAGFSKDAGLPVLKDFLNEMRRSLNWLKKNGRVNEFKATRDVLLFRKAAASAALRIDLNVENIEDLFSLVAALGESKLSQEVSTAIAATLEYCTTNGRRKTMSAVVREDAPRPDNWEQVSEERPTLYRIPIYDLYAGLLSSRFCVSDEYTQNTIISFNYDTVLEDSLRTLQVPFAYGFKPTSVKYDDSFHGMQGEEGRPLRILKLHGSVNWAKPETGRGKLSVFGNYSDIFEAGRKVLLIPPTWKKDFSGALGDVWEGAVKALTEATRIVIIGFSLPPTDVHIKYLLAAGLQDNISLTKILCIDNNPNVESNLYQVVKEELKTQGISEFSNRKVQNVFDMVPSYHMFCESFNRKLTDEIRHLEGPSYPANE